MTEHGNWYYLDPATGAMATGWTRVDGQWYYMTSGGVMRTGWLKDGGAWYYLTPRARWPRDGSTWAAPGTTSGTAVR